MFTVKSPSSKSSRINLRTSSETLGPGLRCGWAPRGPSPLLPPAQQVSSDTRQGPQGLPPAGGQQSRPRLCSWPHSHEHGTADEEEEVKAAVISKEGVPDTNDVRQQELLGQQQCQPAEGEELGLDVLLLLGRQRRGVGARIHVGCCHATPCSL